MEGYSGTEGLSVMATFPQQWSCLNLLTPCTVFNNVGGERSFTSFLVDLEVTLWIFKDEDILANKSLPLTFSLLAIAAYIFKKKKLNSAD